jgi:hypothetical protein
VRRVLSAGPPARRAVAGPLLRRAAGAGLLALLLASLAAALALAGCGGNADPFTGLYWEPSSGRRVEIRKDGDAYRLYYGAAREAYTAKRTGDELRIAEPLGGQTIVRLGKAEGTLELLSGGKTTKLQPLPEHQ